MRPLVKVNIKDLSLTELETHLAERRQAGYRARQIWQWLYQKRATSFASMTNLSAALRSQLERDFTISRLSLVHKAQSSDGTVKFLFGLDDGKTIESVLIPEAKRLTLCISTQAGCGFGCAFCATALLGLQRNLRASEMIDQVLEVSRTIDPHYSAEGERVRQENDTLAPQSEALNPRQKRQQPSSTPSGKGRGEGDGPPSRITHIVLMGMGEPLANYAQTVKALEALSEPSCGLGISSRRITLSTVGLIPQMKRLMAETRVNLAVSLHAPNEALRNRLMPVNRKYSLQQLIEACRSLPIPRRKRITFEYVLLRGVNDSEEHAEELSKLLKGIRSKVNVIPFNPHSGSAFQRPAETEIQRFQQVLQSQGVQVNIRRPRGDDIQAACGQLQGEESRRRRSPFPVLAGAQ